MTEGSGWVLQVIPSTVGTACWPIPAGEPCLAPHTPSPRTPSLPGSSALGEDRAPPGHSRFQRSQGQPLSFPVCFQGVCLCGCSEQLGSPCSSRRCSRRGLEDTITFPTARSGSFPPPFPLQGTRGIFAPSPLSSRSPPFCRPPLSWDLSGRQEVAMPHLYQDSKPRPLALPGAARATQGSGKSYEELKRECLCKGILFEDPDFPACSSSLFFGEKPPIPFIWKRPGVSMCCVLSFHPAKSQMLL